MPAVILIAVLAALVWCAIVARRLTPTSVAVATVGLGYVFGHSFWHFRVGPLPITTDRLLLGVLFGVAAWCCWRGRSVLRNLHLVDWAVIAMLVWLTVSALLANIGSDADLPTSPFFRLLFSFWAPAGLYLAVRLTPLSTAATTKILAAVTLLGCYLAFTAFAEVTGQWWAVFPRYIADPTLGTHFGRARGPALNSVSLGIHLSLALWAAWTLRPRVSRGWQLAIVAAMAAMTMAILLTYTRSVWLGVALSGFIMLVASVPRRLRLPVAGGTLVVGMVAAIMASSLIVHLKREDSGQVSQHSVQQRTAFAYVSWNMFCDEPLTGVGFGRFYDKKLPYLSDRSQDFELESIRGLHHHNTLLSLLVETGMLGLTAYLAILVGWTAIGIRMAFADDAPLATRQMGRLLLAMLGIYLPSAAFHDLSLIFQDQYLLFLVAGLAVATAEQSRMFAKQPSSEPIFTTPPLTIATPPARAPMPTSTTAAKVSLFGMKIDRVDLADATQGILDWCTAAMPKSCRYVVTPNVDHAVQFVDRADLRQAYTGASLVLADGAPIVAAAKLLGKPLPGRVAGSDLVPSLFRAAGSRSEPLRVFLLGAAPGVADRAAANIRREYPGVEVVGTHCPPLGFEHDDDANQAAINAVAVCQPDVVVIGLGAPKQELWAYRHAGQLQAKVALCAGATIDFLAGEKARSPVWMQRVGLEWLHRVLSEPRRLAKRYLRDAVVFPQLVWAEWQATGA